MPRRLLLALSLVPALAGCASRAARLTAPRFFDGDVKVRRERVRISCTERENKLACPLTARLELAEGDAARAVFVIGHNKAVRPTRLEEVDGDVRVEALLEPVPPVRFFDPEPALARHHLMKHAFGIQGCRYNERGCDYRLEYRPVRPADRAADYQLSFDVEPPPGWWLQVYEHPKDDRLVAELGSGQDTFAPGGPFFGVGAAFEPERALAFRTGWEVFAPHYVAHALAVEADLLERVTIALTSELMSPWGLVLPSFGVGVGLPVRVAPTIESGLRLQLSAQFPYGGVVFTADVFPSSKEWLSRSLYVQVAL